jgi:ribosomal protein S18 acetylase RimI-like enzyme
MIIDKKLLPIKNISLNVGLYITDFVEDDDMISIHDKYADDNYWNYAYLKQPKLDLEKAKRYYHDMKLAASVYFLESEENQPIKDDLATNGFELSYSDAIMVLHGQAYEPEQKFEIKEVADPKLEKDFLKVYKEVFVDAGNDVYSGLTDGYLRNIENYFRNYPKDNRYDVVAYKDNEPVGIATVVYDDDYALLMNGAVSPSCRRMGIAKVLTNKCINKFCDKIIFLLTEKDSANEEIWQRIGFKTEVVGKCYKQSWPVKG